MGHTKGPWALEGVYCGYEILAPDSKWPNGTRVIAKTHNTGDESEYSANAKLMAASPKLLAACKDAVAMIEDSRMELTKSITLRTLKAAIEAAEVGQP